MGVAEDFMSDLRLVVVGGLGEEGGGIPFASSMDPLRAADDERRWKIWDMRRGEEEEERGGSPSTWVVEERVDFRLKEGAEGEKT